MLSDPLVREWRAMCEAAMRAANCTALDQIARLGAVVQCKFGSEWEMCVVAANCVNIYDAQRVGERVQVRQKPTDRWADGVVTGVETDVVKVSLLPDGRIVFTMHYVCAILGGLIRRAKPSQILCEQMRHKEES